MIRAVSPLQYVTVVVSPGESGAGSVLDFDDVLQPANREAPANATIDKRRRGEGKPVEFGRRIRSAWLCVQSCLRLSRTTEVAVEGLRRCPNPSGR